MHYRLSVAGGTFDHFHAGHQAFLRAALAQSEHLLLGITSDTYPMQHKQLPGSIEPYAARRQQVIDFLERTAASQRVTIEPIDSVFTPKAWADLPIEAIFVTEDTVQGAKVINDSRKNLPPLDVVIVPIQLNQLGQKISSTDIRAGSIDPAGDSYFPEALRQQDLVLPESERDRFKEPLGQLYKSFDALPMFDSDKLVTVGDEVTRACNQHGLEHNLAVVDFSVQRQETYSSIQDLGFDGSEITLEAANQAGHISAALSTAISEAVEQLASTERIVLVVAGEEDLAVLPLLLMLPLGFTILYGQPNEGIIAVPVTPEAKEHARDLLAVFEHVT